MNIFTSVALGWLGRRVADWGGWIATFLGFAFALYSQLPPDAQHQFGAAFQQLVTGHWREITLGHVATVLGAVALVWSQRKSFKATTAPQVVTPDGEKVKYEQLAPAAQREVTVTAKQAPKRSKTIADMIAEKLGR